MTPEDIELVKRAAKAAGYTIEPDDETTEGTVLFWCNELDELWNPLTDDGDALRLAVKLRFDICHDDNDPHETEDRQIRHVNVWTQGRGAVSTDLDGDTDPYAATRRAIVCAAAMLE